MFLQEAYEKAKNNDWLVNKIRSLRIQKKDIINHSLIFAASISEEWGIERGEKLSKYLTFTDLKKKVPHSWVLNENKIKCLKFGWESGIERGKDLERQNHKDLIVAVKSEIEYLKGEREGIYQDQVRRITFENLLQDLGYYIEKS
jgi:hypothetical protein